MINRCKYKFTSFSIKGIHIFLDRLPELQKKIFIILTAIKNSLFFLQSPLTLSELDKENFLGKTKSATLMPK